MIRLGSRYPAFHSVVVGSNPSFADDVWELYNVDVDFSQANNLAASNPEKLKELQELFNKEGDNKFTGKIKRVTVDIGK